MRFIKTPFETWRKLMLAGALLLLVGSIADAMRGGAPDDSLVRTLVNGVAYGLLFAGFGLAMRRRMANQKLKDAAASESADEGGMRSDEADDEDHRSKLTE